MGPAEGHLTGPTSGRLSARERRADELREVGDGAGIGAAQPGAEVIPERDAELGAGFGEAEKGIAAIATESLRVPPLIFRW